MGAEREGVPEVCFITDAPQNRNAQESVENNCELWDGVHVVLPVVAKPLP